MYLRIHVSAFASAIAFTCLCPSLHAQTTGTILGQVIDATNAGVGSASIEAENLGTHLTRKVGTSADVSLVKAQVAAGGAVGPTNFRDDVNANGATTSADVSITKAQVAAGAQLPTPP